jgi:purine-nucleoside phosphorylase
MSNFGTHNRERMHPMEQLEELASYLRERGIKEVDCAIVLGTGLGDLAQHIVPTVTLGYNQMPHLPVATVEYHFGKLLYGELEGRKVLAWQGRFHYYEGYGMDQIVMPVRVSRLLGARAVLLSNAAGGLRPGLKKGSLLCIDDHINLLPEHPLRGPNLDALGERFPDMSQPYHAGLQRALHEAADEAGLRLESGVYVSVPGPCLETRAEYRYLRTIGADAVGMSTVPEVIACAHMGMPCAAVSVITDECDPDRLAPFHIADIVAVARSSEAGLTSIVRGALRRLDEALAPRS